MGGFIQVRSLPLEVAPQTLGALTRWLSDEELERAARFRFERDRRRFIVARARLREQLAERVGRRPDEIGLATGPHGRPFVVDEPELRFSLSHCGELAVAAFARGGEIGVDLEALRPVPEADAIAPRLFAPQEYQVYRALEPGKRISAFCSAWTRKEAYLKALGGGLSMALDTPLAEGWSVESFSPWPGFIAAVAWQKVTTCAPS